MANVLESLRRVPLFSRLSDRDLDRLGRVMGQRTFPEGHTITSEGKGGVAFFIVEDGNADVSVKGETVRTLGPGDYFGEVALIDQGPRSATIVASSELVCRGMTAWEFKPFVHEHPEIAWQLLETLVGRLREVERRPAD